MTGHAFQVFLTDDDVLAALATMRRHLVPGGIAAFETRNPLAREWETWREATTRERFEHPGTGAFEAWDEIEAVEGELVSFATTYRFDSGETLVSHSTLRFLPEAALSALLRRAGFATVEIRGDWDGSPFEAGSPEIIVLAG